jgi:formylglycine-generating enzyme required for sulfatase activity
VGFVPPGTGKHIVWNAFNDWAGNYTTNAKVRLTADASFKGVAINTTNAAPATNLVWIPSGSFAMSQGPNVYISRGFWMGKFEVTQSEFVAVMTNNPSHDTSISNLPVDGVSWSDAVLYCQRLNAREQSAGRLPAGWQYRLPTEAEWEYACRAGTTTTYYFGNDSAANRLPFYAWCSFNANGGTQPVGSRAPNRWGLYDMYGNVEEWCSDWFYAFSGGNVTDPQGPSSGSVKVRRGGSWNSPNCRSDRCNNNFLYPSVDCIDASDTGSRASTFGFRVVLAQTP